MPKRIFKYVCPILDSFTLSLPAGAELLDVQTQHGVPVLWAAIDDEAPAEPREFILCGTGHPMPSIGHYIGTFQLHGGHFIGHLFESQKCPAP